MPGQPTGKNTAWAPDWRSQRRQERWQRRSDRRAARSEHRGGGLVFGLILILIGGMLALHQIVPSFDFNLTWPVAIVAVGLLLVASSVRRNPKP
jgi:chemotaxis response regulator CheB